MKINKYYIAAGVALLVILIVVFTQRSDWDENNFILSADSEGNLTPISEKYFDDNEKRLINVVNTKLAEVSKRVEQVNGALDRRITTNANNIRNEARAALQRNQAVAARAETIHRHHDKLKGDWLRRGVFYKIFTADKHQLHRWGDDAKTDRKDSGEPYRMWKIG